MTNMISPSIHLNLSMTAFGLIKIHYVSQRAVNNCYRFYYENFGGKKIFKYSGLRINISLVPAIVGSKI